MREQDKPQSEVIQRKFLCQLIYKKWCPQSRITRCSTGLPALLAVVILLSFGPAPVEYGRICAQQEQHLIPGRLL